MEKYDRAGQATDDNIIRRMRFACWITKAINVRSENMSLITFSTAVVVKAPCALLYVRRLSCYL